jgi:hypothetical protein
VYRARIKLIIDSLDRKKSQRGHVAAILKGVKITEVMSKPNDSRQREKILEQGKNIFDCLNNKIKMKNQNRFSKDKQKANKTKRKGDSRSLKK